MSLRWPEWPDEETGQAVVEYALVVGLVSALLIGGLVVLANTTMASIVQIITSGLPA